MLSASMLRRTGRLPRLLAIPNSRPTTVATMVAPSTSDSVTGSRGPSSAVTDWPFVSELPSVPCSTPSSQCQYCTETGRLSPSWARTWAIWAAVELTPAIS